MILNFETQSCVRTLANEQMLLMWFREMPLNPLIISKDWMTDNAAWNSLQKLACDHANIC